jgi:DNA-binding NtrC family response regulator
MSEPIEVRFIRTTSDARPTLNDADIRVVRALKPTTRVYAFVVGPHAQPMHPVALQHLEMRSPDTPTRHVYAINTRNGTDEQGEDIASYLTEKGISLLPEHSDIQFRLATNAPAEWVSALTMAIAPHHHMSLHVGTKVLPIPRRTPPPRPALDPGACRILGSSPAIRAFRQDLEALGPRHHPVLLLAEVGLDTREAVRWIHKSGGRTGRRITQRLRGLPDDQATSLMFGHQSQPGVSEHTRTGRIRESVGGAISVPDLFELSLPMQARFIRALKHATDGKVLVEPLNSFDAGVQVDTRFIGCATDEPNGYTDRTTPTVTRELFLHVAHAVVRWPPLRERTEDIAEIAAASLASAGMNHTLGDAAVDRLKEHSWLGNERELELVLSHAVRRAGAREALTERDVSAALRVCIPSVTASSLPVPCNLAAELKRIEIATMEAAMRAAEDSATKAGGLIGLGDPKNLTRDLRTARERLSKLEKPDAR